MKKTNQLSAEILRGKLIYEQDSGLFFFRKSDGSRGTCAGSKASRYVKIGIDGVYHYAHRLAWLYVTGFMPENLIDHINGDRHDNRFENLRQATHQENSWNSSPSSKSISGCNGVRASKSKGGWVATIVVNGKSKTIGVYNLKEDAINAREIEAEKIHGIFHKKHASLDANDIFTPDILNSFCSAKSKFICL